MLLWVVFVALMHWCLLTSLQVPVTLHGELRACLPTSAGEAAPVQKALTGPPVSDEAAAAAALLLEEERRAADAKQVGRAAAGLVSL